MFPEHAWTAYVTQLHGPYSLQHNRPLAPSLADPPQPGKGWVSLNFSPGRELQRGFHGQRPGSRSSLKHSQPGIHWSLLPPGLFGQSLLPGVTNSFAVGTRRTGKEEKGHGT